MNLKSAFGKLVSRIWGNHIFFVLLLFNILANATAIQSYWDAWSIIMILCISALSASIESFICQLFKNKTLRNCVFYVLIAAHLFTAVIDYFLIANFKLIFTGDTIGILAETTPDESKAFLSTYLTIWNLLFIIAAICGIIWFAIWLSRKLAKFKAAVLVSIILSIIGASVYAFNTYAHVVKGEGGKSVSQLHSFTRFAYSFVTFKGTYENIKYLREVNRNVNATLRQADAPSIIVVIGESFSLYHSSLYGYSKPTNPRLSQRVQDGSMVVFDDVVSASDHTGIVMSTVFIVNGSNEPGGKEVMFPTCFRNAGYKTAMLDNQYFINKGFSWLTDGKLSDIMFDYRNPKKLGLDDNLVKAIPEFPDPQMIILHLFGQHFTYSDRYTSDFKRFTADDYSKDLSEEEREIIAHYDNCTLFNDYVVDGIIKKFEDKNCLIIYFSDHGEEIYEIDDFMGHGNAAQRPTIKYQIRVPMMIWTSEKFDAKYPDVVKRIHESNHKPIITENIAHFLFDIAGIETKCYRPEMSFISENYPASPSRLVLGSSIDYDKYKEDPTFKPRY